MKQWLLSTPLCSNLLVSIFSYFLFGRGSLTFGSCSPRICWFDRVPTSTSGCSHAQTEWMCIHINVQAVCLVYRSNLSREFRPQIQSHTGTCTHEQAPIHTGGGQTARTAADRAHSARSPREKQNILHVFERQHMFFRYHVNSQSAETGADTWRLKSITILTQLVHWYWYKSYGKSKKINKR